jgi:hypothetical protein
MRTEDQTGIEEKMTKTGMDKIKENIQILDKNKKHTAKCKIVFFIEIQRDYYNHRGHHPPSLV